MRIVDPWVAEDGIVSIVRVADPLPDWGTRVANSLQKLKNVTDAKEDDSISRCSIVKSIALVSEMHQPPFA